MVSLLHLLAASPAGRAHHLLSNGSMKLVRTVSETLPRMLNMGSKHNRTLKDGVRAAWLAKKLSMAVRVCNLKDCLGWFCDWGPSSTLRSAGMTKLASMTHSSSIGCSIEVR